MSDPLKKVVVVGIGNDPIRDLVGAVSKALDREKELEKLKTYAFEFARFSLVDSEHFKRTNLYYDANSMHAVYDCDLDGRKYDVRIQALK
jgi:hypothetical protein